MEEKKWLVMLEVTEKYGDVYNTEPLTADKIGNLFRPTLVGLTTISLEVLDVEESPEEPKVYCRNSLVPCTFCKGKRKDCVMCLGSGTVHSFSDNL